MPQVAIGLKGKTPQWDKDKRSFTVPVFTAPNAGYFIDSRGNLRRKEKKVREPNGGR